MRFRRNFDMLDEFFNELNRSFFTDQFYAPYANYPSTHLLPSGQELELYKKPSLDVKEKNDEVIVTVDLPGVEKENVKARLVNPRVLELACEQKTEREDKKDGYYLKERTYGYIKRMVPLPSDVTDINAKMELKNGVLDIRFKKIQIEQKEYLKLE